MYRFSEEAKIAAIEIIKENRIGKRRGITPIALAQQLLAEGYIRVNRERREVSLKQYGIDVVANIREDLGIDGVITIDERYIVPRLPRDIDLIAEWAADRGKYEDTHLRRSGNEFYKFGQVLDNEEFADASELIISSQKLVRSAIRKMGRLDG